ncbi:MAG TPA: acyltransferase family protein [Pseudidiomarina sp.]|nr:acyltransferase family protein [Pseudidiomarina sp.]
MKYRRDIDGLRAIAVLSVIAFHAGISGFAGGYVGVDVFFVISGYLITTLIYQDIQQQRFSFANFYKRRAARLLPALSVTLLVVLLFGFVFYDTQTFDQLGKEVFFSSFGAANLYFANGVNYFTSDESQQPLIHLWSLGVEEQFYIVWPVILLLVMKFKRSALIPLTLLLFVVSLVYSELEVLERTTAGYFLPQYRAFELLIGAMTAFWLTRGGGSSLANGVRQLLALIGMVLVIVPMLLLNEDSGFPGINALWPCLGTALLIAFPHQGPLTQLLSTRAMVLIGLISYPLYLYHQPLITFTHVFDLGLAPWSLFTLVVIIAGLAAWLTYRYLEMPVRNWSSKGSRRTKQITLTLLVATIPAFAVVGLAIAKLNGVPQRFQILNPFAADISQAHALPFYTAHETGYQVSTDTHGGILFIGDSVLQQYVPMLTTTLGYSQEQIDTVTRGQCVLLKGVSFVDMISDISCEGLRDQLYSLDKTYDYVVISQDWRGYNQTVLNFAADQTEHTYARWHQLLTATIEHFQARANTVMVVGAHPLVTGTRAIQSSVFIQPETYRQRLDDLAITNTTDAARGEAYFAQLAASATIQTWSPIRLFCPNMPANTDAEACQLHNGTWSFFNDPLHLTVAAMPFVERQLELLGVGAATEPQ